MGKIQDIRDRLLATTVPVVEEKLLTIIKQNDEQFIRLNHNQLFAGVDSNDRLLRPPYQSDVYARFKLKLNPAGVVDLKVKGNFWNGWFVSANQFPVFMGSTDEKTFSLVGKYGENIFGLDKRNLAVVSKETVQPKLVDYYRSIFHV